MDDEVALGVGGDLERARAALALVGLAGFDAGIPVTCPAASERLGLAAVLVTEPDLLVLDEPTRGMDPERKLELAALLRSQAEERATLVVTHDLVFAAEVADRIVRTAPARRPSMPRSALLAVRRGRLRRRGVDGAVARTRLWRSCSWPWLSCSPGSSGWSPGTGSAKEIALVAVLGGAAAAGRVLFAAVPGVQPVTVVAVAAGAALGARVGSRSAQSPRWSRTSTSARGLDARGRCSPGAVAASSARLAAGLIRNRWAFAALCFALGFAFSGAMDLWYWYSFWPHTWEALTLVFARGLWFSAFHAVGNVSSSRSSSAQAALRLLERYGRRLSGGRMGLKLAVIASSALALAAATPADYVASASRPTAGSPSLARSDSALRPGPSSA